MRYARRLKERFFVMILRLFGIDPAKERLRMVETRINKKLAEVGLELKISGDLTVVDAEGNFK